MKKYLSLLFILGFSCILLLQLTSERVLLTDDLARIRESRYYTSFSSFIINFLNTNTMSSRPISGIFYAPSIYLIRYLDVEIYYINYLFYLSSLVMIYIVISKFYDNKVATLGTFIYSILPIGTSIVFSPIMMNSALATIFYCISLLFILKIKENSLIVERERERERFYVLLSIIFFFLSVLSYEIFIPLILLNAYLLPTNKISYKLLYLIITLGLIFGYRQILEPLLFSNYFHRNNNVNILNLSRNIKIIKEIALIFSIRLPNAIFRGIKAIIFYEIKDYILLLIGSFFSYFIIFKQNYSYSNKKKHFLYPIHKFYKYFWDFLFITLYS